MKRNVSAERAQITTAEKLASMRADLVFRFTLL